MKQRKKRKYLERLFDEVAIDMVGNNHEMKVYIYMGQPHDDNKLAHFNQVSVSMNIKGKLLLVQFPLIKFIRSYATYDLERKVLFEKYKPTVPADFAKIVNAFDSTIGLDKIVEDYGWKTKSSLIRHMVEHWEKEGRSEAAAKQLAEKRRAEERQRQNRLRYY